MVKLSIIIPVYNVEAYVERCIRSVAEQNIPQSDYEIIIIDDGATDRSLAIVESLRNDYENIKVHSQENTGLGGARNKGISLASGEYLWFIDSDDFIQKNVLLALIEKISNYNLDVLAFDFNCTDKFGNEINWIDFKFDFNNQQVISGSEFYSRNYNDSYIWLYLFKRKLFIENNIYFRERINMQDSEILPKLMVHVENISFLNKIVYSYVNRENSFINSKNKEVRIKYYYSIIEVGKSLSDFKIGLSENERILAGINNKMKAINKMLFLQFIYNDFDKDTLKKIIVDLRVNNFYPFKPVISNSKNKRIVYNFLRYFINKNPILSRMLYKKLKVRKY